MFGEPEGAGTDAPPVETADTSAAIDAGDDAAGSDANGADEKVAIPRKEYLAIKEARENEKKLQLRVEQLEAEKGKAAPPTPASPDAEETRARIEEREGLIADLKAAARAGNRDAKALLLVHEDALAADKRALASEERQVYRFEMQDVPEARREDVKKYMREQGLRSPAVADRLLRGDRAGSLEQQVANLQKQLDDLKKPAARGEPPDTRVRGGGARKPSNGGPEEITTTDYNKRMKDNPNKTIADRRAGKFVLLD